ncbi:MAG: hypothetical protein Kow00121_56150 [Elainellaceae cyanobacterium]
MQYDKLGPGLSSLVEAYQQGGKAALRGSFQELGVVASEADYKVARISVTIECDEDADLESLSQYGIRINQPQGSIRTAFLPVNRLDELSEHPAVFYIHPARYSDFTMDVAASTVELPAFVNRTGLTGKGVIIGIVDSGIDPKHPAFRGRILSIWDQTAPGSGVAGIGAYGFEYTGSQIVGSRDVIGHGTHVAGIAAGAEVPYRGVAPEANLVIVKTDLKDTSVMDGVRYVFAKARAAKQPAVVNLSLRSHFNPHDGTDIMSRLVDSESGAGRIVCAAAGNDGGEGDTGGVRLHAEIPLRQGISEQVIFSIPGSSADAPLSLVSLTGWYARQDTIEVAVTSPSGFSTSTTSPEASNNPNLKRYRLEGKYIVEIETPRRRRTIGNGDKNVVIRISKIGRTDSNPIPIDRGFWKLRIRGTTVVKGLIDIWATNDSPTSNIQFVSPLKFLTDRKKIGSPGAAAQAITVAAFTTRTQWPRKNGTIQTASGVTKGEIASFSSPGPARDGQPKPDLAAPGAFLISALSRDSKPDPIYIVNDYYRANAGTSMSTPFIAGVVALLLQRNSQLTPEQVKAILRKASQIPGQATGAFDPMWGYGLIDMSKIQ